MSIRGAYGFRYNNKDKIAFSFSDSQPSCLGKKIFNFVKNHSDLEMQSIFNRIELVKMDAKIPKKMKERYIKYSYVDNPSNWYELLYLALDNIEAFVKDIDHMVDFGEFLRDSLFCKWAYIINLDTSKLEIYKGSNKKPGKGRYAKYCYIKNSVGTYYGVSLIEEISFDIIRNLTFDMIENCCYELEYKDIQEPVDEKILNKKVIRL